MPDIADEFRVHTKRVWRGGMGSIAATHVTVWSKWGEEAAPVPAKSEKDADNVDDEATAADDATFSDTRTSTTDADDLTFHIEHGSSGITVVN